MPFIRISKGKKEGHFISDRIVKAEDSWKSGDTGRREVDLRMAVRGGNQKRAGQDYRKMVRRNKNTVKSRTIT